jgi:putative serine protease PepD
MAEAGTGRSGRTAVLIVGAVVLAIVAGGVGGAIGSWMTQASTGSSPGAALPGEPSTSSCDAVSVADRVLPSVVTISVETATGDGVGTGEIIRSSGYILTNNHVIAAAATSGTISVLYSDGTAVAAKLVGRNPQGDLAVLKVSSASALPTIAVADSSSVRVGEPVVALGAPLGLSSSVSAGIVSALGRDVPVPSDNGATATLRGAIQTDASINPGNSGGALVNCAGQLIGVNTAIATVPNASGISGGGSVGIGFAIPSASAVKEADRLIDGTASMEPYFGASVAPIPPAVAERFGITGGLYVDSVDPTGPAAKAGLRVGDVITALDGKAATSGESLVAAVSNHSAGDLLGVKYLRDGASTTVNVKLTAVP